MLIKSTKNYNTTSIKALIYGMSGVGKTTLMSTVNEKVLGISAESGLLSVSNHDIDYVDLAVGDGGELLSPLDKYERLKEVGAYLTTDAAKATYKWIFLDSLTEIGQIVHEAIKMQDPKFQDAKNNLQLWGLYGERMRSLIKFFRDLPSYNIIFTALAKPEKDELSRRIYSIDLQGSISDKLPGYFDEVFYYEVFVNENGEKVRRLITQPSDKYVAKDRSGKLDEYEQPNLSLIAQKIRGEK